MTADPTSERSTRILRTARRLLRAGWARGWSEALKMAKQFEQA
jgi:hypothetical protein